MDDPYRARSFGDKPVGFGVRPAVVVVDFQKSYTEPQYALGGSQLVEDAVNNTATLLATARQHGIPVVACGMAYRGAADMPRWKITAMYNGEFFKGHPAVDLDPRIYDRDYDLALTKTAPSVFFGTPLASYFSLHAVDTVIITGCNTSGCVRASVIDSFSHGWRTIIPRECVGDVDVGPQLANLTDMERRYADVLPLATVIEYLSKVADRRGG